ncbi:MULTISPECIES: preprotein translocase subunit SecE [Candidatus Ichthyocystis]|uniref:Protein translocase subunit SecE n=1 Tax=Candidatus Ichthyocystis hellenicum TaxID=1561003 RepID=A0A0S4M0R4_9BURK|nr:MULTISPECIES: preprotein translocase subunit SecE [Ichthyocystis]CUT17326.1 putative Preprotein translocase subunit SecE [Candidatus Ichthyocystis hellenicum]
MIEKIRVVLFFLVFSAGILFFSFFPTQTVITKVGVGVASVIVCGLLFYYSKLGQRLVVFSRESVREASKVFWPTRKETMQLVLVVFVFTVVVALYIFFVDKFLEWFLYDLILGWR